MENFMPKGQSEIKLGPDWGVLSIIAKDENEAVPFTIKGGVLTKLPTRHFISPDRLREINIQVRAIYRDYEEKAALARELKKSNWSYGLEKYGVRIEKDGSLKISYWEKKTDGPRKKKWRTLPEIQSAIRQQDHTIEGYLLKKSQLENGREISPELASLLKKLRVVRPYIEMRREVLLYAQKQMDWSIGQADNGLKEFLAAGKFFDLPKRLDRMAIFLNNSWPNPYRGIINRVLPKIREANKSLALRQWGNAKARLLEARDILAEALKTISRQSDPAGLLEIGPISIMAEVEKYHLADEVLLLAKKFLTEPPHYYKKFGLFRLNAILAVSQLVITGHDINREKILKLCE